MQQAKYPHVWPNGAKVRIFPHQPYNRASAILCRILEDTGVGYSHEIWPLRCDNPALPPILPNNHNMMGEGEIALILVKLSMLLVSFG